MFVFRSVQKTNQTLIRREQTVCLGDALRELFQVYDHLGGGGLEAAKALEAQIERSMGVRGVGRQEVQARVATLFRAKDMHAFLLEEPDWRDLKLQVMEMILFNREPVSRWAAIREVLLDSLPTLCNARTGGSAGLEQVKREISDRGSRISRLLQTVALFNFDQDQERPPANLMIRFSRGRFPEHFWETEAAPGSVGTLAQDSGWTPAEPLCRWEFLGADLLHAALRKTMGHTVPEVGMDQGAMVEMGEARGEVQWHCSLESSSENSEGVEQMPLLPYQPEQFQMELTREVYRKWGAEGARALVLLLEQLSAAQPGQPFWLDLESFTRAEGSARKQQERHRKVWAVLERLSRVEAHQTFELHGRRTIHSSPLVALLEVGREADAHQGRTAKGEEKPGQTVRVMVDQCFFVGGGQSLAQAYRELPESLLAADPTKHPQALLVYLWLRRAWSEGKDGSDGVSCSARQVLANAGVWVSDSSRYRALESLKRELNFLQESGLLSRWKLSRNSTRDAMEDIYCMEANHRTEGRGADASGLEQGHFWSPPFSHQHAEISEFDLKEKELEQGGPADLLSSGG